MDCVSPIIYKKFGLNNNQEIPYYDKYSKKIVVIADEDIKIFSKNFVLKKTMNLKISKNKVTSVAIDKLLRYLIISVESKMILVINLRTEKVVEIINYDQNLILYGLFFILDIYSSNPSLEEPRFCLVFNKKFACFRISNGRDEKSIEYKQIKSNFIKNFYYNPDFLVLCLEKKEKTFDFYNMINEKKIVKYEFQLPLRNNTGRKSKVQKLFGYFRNEKEKENLEEVLKLDNLKETLYKRTHFFLEKIYKKLYFICMNYEESEIQIYHVESLISINKAHTIPFDPSQISTLQIIDNLIVIHNFERCESLCLDLKSDSQDKVIFRNFPITSSEIHESNTDIISNSIKPVFIYESENLNEENPIKLKIEYQNTNLVSMVSYDNKMFYDFNIEIQGASIFDHSNKNFYMVSFDSEIYYDNVQLKYEAVFNLIRRKNSKETILNALYELVKSKFLIKILKIVFNKIVRQLYKTIYNKKFNIKEEELDFDFEKTQKQSSYEIVDPKIYTNVKKLTILKQSDIYNQLFKTLEFNQKADIDYMVKILIHYINSLNNYQIPIQPSFYTILLSFLKKLKNFNMINIFLQYHVIPDHIEIAKFLIDIGTEKNNIINLSMFQLGIDMLVRLMKYEEIFQTFIRFNMIFEALSFVNRYKVKIEYLSVEIVEKLRELVKSNPNLIRDFISY